MPFSLPHGEPAAGPWRVVPFDELVATVLDAAGRPEGRPAVVAIDGRGGGGKSTVAQRLHAAVAASTVVHTDDIAWYEPYFTWAPLLADGVLAPVRRGQPVSFRPPQWERLGRDGAIEVPTGLELVVLEGVGAGQRALAPLIDAVVWVQSDFAEAERRGIARDVERGVNGDPGETVTFWHEWMAEELPLLERERPWERACVVVAGTFVLRHAPHEVVVADGPLMRDVESP